MAVSAAYLRSHAKANASPAPAAGPGTRAIVGFGIRHSFPLVARWFSRWRWMRASSDGPGRSPRSSAEAAMLFTSPPAQKAPPAPVFTWTGFYIGAHVGGGWARTDWTDPAGPPFDLGSHTATGWLGGFQVGGRVEAHDTRAAAADVRLDHDRESQPVGGGQDLRDVVDDAAFRVGQLEGFQERQLAGLRRFMREGRQAVDDRHAGLVAGDEVAHDERAHGLPPR